jgi:putative membrane protein
MMGGFDGMMHGGWGAGWGALGWLGMLIPLLFWGGLIALIVWAVVRIFPAAREGESSASRSPKPAEEILRERFARGEIGAEEYQRSLEVLQRETRYAKGGI